MNARLTRLLDESAGGYLGEDDQRRLLEYALSLPDRFRASDAVERAEERAVADALDEVRASHADELAGAPKAVVETLADDLRRALRYAVLAMVRDDEDFQEERLLAWMRSVRSHLNVPAGLTRGLHEALRERLREALPEPSFALLEPFLDANVEGLTADDERQLAG